MTDPKAREELKYAHRGWRDTEARRDNREKFVEHIADLLEDQEPSKS